MTTDRIDLSDGQFTPSIETAGPLFGPSALSVDITEGDARTAVRIYPDAANKQLRDAGLATRFYLQPTTAIVAERQAGSGFDFTLSAVVRRLPASGVLEYVNATGTLTTTLAVPPSALEIARTQLTERADTELPPRMRDLFKLAGGDPEPQLTAIPLLHSSASCVFRRPEGAKTVPRFSAQGAPGASAGMQPHNSYLLSCGPDEAEAIATSLKSGRDFPLQADYLLTEQFSTGDSNLDVTVIVDVDKLYAELACVAAADGSVTERDVSAVVARACTTGESLHLKVTAAGTALAEPDLVSWFGHCVEVRNAVVDLVGTELFDGPGDGIALKTSHRNRGLQLNSTLVLSGPISAERTVPTDFSALTAAAKTNITTYLSEIGAG